jgi:hypothetical protein
VFYRTITKAQLEEYSVQRFAAEHENRGQGGYNPPTEWYSNYIEDGVVSTQLLNFLDSSTAIKEPQYTQVVQLTQTSNVREYVSGVANTLSDGVTEFSEGESGQVIYRIEKLVVMIYNATALTGSSYIELPEYIRNKKACINPKNDDDKCAMYAVKASLYHNKIKHNPERVSNLMKIDDPTDYSMLKFPTPLTGWDKFERVNKVSINIYGLDENKARNFVLRTSKLNFEAGHQMVNLLFVDDGVKNHYVCVKNMCALLCTQENKKHAKKHYCPCCLNSFYNETKYNEHIALNCQSYDAVKTIYPPKGGDKQEDKVFFKNTQNKLKCPCVVYADYETLQDSNDNKCSSQNQDKGSSTYLYSKHREESVRYLMLYNGKVFAYKCFSGKDCSAKFIEALQNDCEEAKGILSRDVGMSITKEQQECFAKATACHICKKDLGDHRVRDHCHLTGEYRGAAHNKCNLRHNFKNFKIPCFFHNFKGYDAQLVLNGINKFSKDKVNCIAQNSEKFITFTLNNNIVFKDSFAFLSSSLEKLANNLRLAEADHGEGVKGDGNPLFKQIKGRFGNNWKLMTEKGIMCYEYLTCDDRLNDTELPPKSAFYSSLTDEDITDEDYDRAKKVWNVFGCKTLREYYHLYLEQDVCLLADIFEEFRDIAMKRFGLDPVWYFTLPGFAWDCMLSLTGVVLDLITDPNMSLMVENGIRGGISCINHRHAKANNPYMSDFDKDQQRSYIMYQDANNLYGWAMSQYLPEKDFEWDEPVRFNETVICQLNPSGTTGHIFEVDLEYPQELHDKHNQYPLAVERLKVSKKQLSNYQRTILSKTKTTTGNTEKLIGSLNDKYHYVVQLQNL